MTVMKKGTLIVGGGCKKRSSFFCQRQSESNRRIDMTKFVIVAFVTLSVCFQTGLGLDNGLARKPPMGWLSWERFRCQVNCTLSPDECISDKLMREIADKMVEDGYLAAGYEYVIIDDCWPEKERDSQGRLLPDMERFPHGMKNLSDYIHSKGLKFGIYEDYGTKTCAGYPGVISHMKEDAEMFASWDVDYVKLDGCNSDPKTMDKGYIEFGNHLNATKRPMVYSCSWPVYQDEMSLSPNYSLIAEHCNLWRNYDDVQDSWASVKNIMSHYGDHQERYAQHAGPGHWNDPDMLIIGNYGLSYEQAKAQMAVWSVMAAPLIMSHDLRKVRPEFREILLNKDAIAINQHPAGIQGKRMYKKNNIEFWTKPLDETGSNAWAVAVVSKREDGAPYRIFTSLDILGMNPDVVYTFTEVFNEMKPFDVERNGNLTVRVPPTGALLFKVSTK